MQRSGIHDFIIVDQLRSGWRHLACDHVSQVWRWIFVDSFFYEQRGDWSRIFAPGDELRDYADDAADQYGLREKLRLSTTAASAMFDEHNSLW